MNHNALRPSALDRQERKRDMAKGDVENKLDGNAAAGTLQSIFSFEMTLVQVTCTTCGGTNPIGATAAYMSRMGTVVRCRACDNALIRVALVKGRNFLDMRGMRVLQISAEVDRQVI